MEELQILLVNTLIGIATALIILAGAYINKYLKKAYERIKNQSEAIKDNNTRRLVEGALDSVDALIEKTVQATQTTMVEGLKKANEDNKLTKEDAENIKNSVVGLVKGQLTEDAKELLNLQLKDLDLYIQTQIEVALAKIKKS